MPDHATPTTTLRRFIFPTWTQRKKTMHTQAWILIALTYITLPIAWLIKIDASETQATWVAIAWFAFMVRTFTYHLGLLLLAVGLIATLTRQKRLAIASLPLILFCILPTWRHYLPTTPTFSATNAFASGSKAFNSEGNAFTSGVGVGVKVMSANLLFLNKNTDAMMAQIQQHDPDLILFQEYTGHWQNAMRDTLYATYPHRVEHPLNHSFGAAIFSKTPFVDPPHTLDYSTPDTPQLRTAIQHAGRTIAVYNIHLMPPTSIINTIDQRRSHARLTNILQNETRPTILGGDFNFTTDTRMAAALRNLNFTDAQYTAGSGPGTTWPAHSIFAWLPIPGLRIDHLYLNSHLIPLHATTGEPHGSDHRPIITTLGFRALVE